jgi:hypothetical protein
MGLKVSFGNALAGILYGEVTTPNHLDVLDAEDISLDTPVNQFEFAASESVRDATGLFRDFLGHTSNASYNSRMVLKDETNPDYQPTLRDYLKYAADRAVEEGHTATGLDITVSKPNGSTKKHFTYADLSR